MTPVAMRHRWAAELLRAAPTDAILEVGCGHGLATGLVCAGLKSGHLTAIDRSPAMVAACRKRNSVAVAGGKLTVIAGGFEDTAFPQGYDKVFAVNVDFPLHKDERWARKLAEVLKPHGIAVLVLEAPAAATANRFAMAAKTALDNQGFAAEIVAGPGMVGVQARRG
jgi:SAM-dependent methyltransferase